MQAVIYQIRNIVNDKTYIGRTINWKKRWVDHRNRLRGNIHYNVLLQRAWNKYGEHALETKRKIREWMINRK